MAMLLTQAMTMAITMNTFPAALSTMARFTRTFSSLGITESVLNTRALLYAVITPGSFRTRQAALSTAETGWTSAFSSDVITGVTLSARTFLGASFAVVTSKTSWGVEKKIRGSLRVKECQVKASEGKFWVRGCKRVTRNLAQSLWFTNFVSDKSEKLKEGDKVNFKKYDRLLPNTAATILFIFQALKELRYDIVGKAYMDSHFPLLHIAFNTKIKIRQTYCSFSRCKTWMRLSGVLLPSG